MFEQPTSTSGDSTGSRAAYSKRNSTVSLGVDVGYNPVDSSNDQSGFTQSPTVTYSKSYDSSYRAKTRRLSEQQESQSRARTEEPLFRLHTEDDQTTKQMDTIFRVAVLGDKYVGKSTFIRRLAIGKDGGDIGVLSQTVGLDFEFMGHAFNGKKIGLQVYDTAGEEKHRVFLRTYLRPMDGVFFLYDCTRRETFENLKDWHAIVQNTCASHVTVAVLANKIDLVEGSHQHHKKVTDREGQKIANTFGETFGDIGLYMATSGRSGIGVAEVCSVLIQNMLAKEESVMVHSRYPTPLPAPVSRRKCCRSA
ncbi:ras-related protein Rab-13-like [Sycon ciliatum]|uniref:ras-related protein Rab-13-like n=1 Tax=Sycon ciliatum TaxID=27933 RepID=UPI0031F67BEB